MVAGELRAPGPILLLWLTAAVLNFEKPCEFKPLNQKLVQNVSGALPARAARFQYVKGVARPYTCSFFALAVTWELTSDENGSPQGLDSEPAKTPTTKWSTQGKFWYRLLLDELDAIISKGSTGNDDWFLRFVHLGYMPRKETRRVLWQGRIMPRSRCGLHERLWISEARGGSKNLAGFEY